MTPVRSLPRLAPAIIRPKTENRAAQLVWGAIKVGLIVVTTIGATLYFQVG